MSVTKVGFLHYGQRLLLNSFIGSDVETSHKTRFLKFLSILADNVSDPLEKPFAFGCTIRQLSAQSTDGEWRPRFVSQTDTDVMHKIWRLQDFSLYLDSDVEILVTSPTAANFDSNDSKDGESAGS